MKITQEEAKNLMGMIESPDLDNGYMALKAIDAHKYDKEDLGYLIFFFKFARFTTEEWRKTAPHAFERLASIIDNTDAPLTYSKALSIMTTNKVNKESIELFLERHVKDFTNMLDQLGYPVDSLSFNISLR